MNKEQIEYAVGDSIGTTQFRWLDCLVSCTSDKCTADQIKRDGYRSGFGYGWDVFVEIDEVGRITGKIVDSLPLPVEKTVAQATVDKQV